MRIYIPSMGRSWRQTTFVNLPIKLQETTTIVVPRDENEIYKAGGFPVISPPPSVVGICATRHWIMTRLHDRVKFGDKLIMLDDDLKFDTRRPDDQTKFTTSTPKGVELMFKAIEKTLNTYAHVGVLAREGGNRVTEKVLYVTRMMRVLAYNLSVVEKTNVSFRDKLLQDDFDFTLQLLRLGYKNAVLCGWVQGQHGSDTKGGASTYRTIETHNESVEKLKKLHPEFVRVVAKETKTSWNGMPRNDVIIAWKKAYDSSQR